jgi:hypothetical protein
MGRDRAEIRRNGPYAPLSATYADDDAIAMLDEIEDDRTELLFVRSLAFCARDPALNGFVSAVALRTGRVLRRKPRKVKDPATKATTEQDVIWHAEQLVKLGLWTAETDGYRIAKWSKWNRTAEEIEAARKRDAARKARGTEHDTD